MFKENDNINNGIKQGENNINSTNGYNENTIFKPTSAVTKDALLKQQQTNLSIIDETYSDPIYLETGGMLMVE
jgi:hypothetical protein